jgi:hypothetical protein
VRSGWWWNSDKAELGDNAEETSRRLWGISSLLCSQTKQNNPSPEILLEETIK